MPNPEGDTPEADSAKSFWVTAPGLITAIGGLLGALAVLIGALAAAGLLGSHEDASVGPAAAPTSSSAGLSSAVLHDGWTVRLQVRAVEGAQFMGNNTLWGIQDPKRGDTVTEDWTLESICPTDPCDVRWDSVQTPDRFAILHRQGATGTYAAPDVGQAGCGSTRAIVKREIELHVTNANDIDGIWSATQIQGEITIAWSCEGQDLGGILDVTGSRNV
jgi:hypothetical protein